MQLARILMCAGLFGGYVAGLIALRRFLDGLDDEDRRKEDEER